MGSGVQGPWAGKSLGHGVWKIQGQEARTRKCAGALGPCQDLARRTLAGMESRGVQPWPRGISSVSGRGRGTHFRASGAWPTDRGVVVGGASAEQGRVCSRA